jgi:hypothetical protein
MSLRDELFKKNKPDLIKYAKEQGIHGYTGRNKEDLINYILNPPPKVSQKSPGRPKGTTTTKVVQTTNANLITLNTTPMVPPQLFTLNGAATVITPTEPLINPTQTIVAQPVITTQIVEWNEATLNHINLAELKKMAVDLGKTGLSGKSKAEVIAQLAKILIDKPITIKSGKSVYNFVPGTMIVKPNIIAPTGDIMSTPLVPVSATSTEVLSLADAIPVSTLAPIVKNPMLSPSKQKLVNAQAAETNDVVYMVGDNTVSIKTPQVGSAVDINGQTTYVVKSITMSSANTYVKSVKIAPLLNYDDNTHMITYNDMTEPITLNFMPDRSGGWAISEDDKNTYVWQ